MPYVHWHIRSLVDGTIQRADCDLTKPNRTKKSELKKIESKKEVPGFERNVISLSPNQLKSF